MISSHATQNKVICVKHEDLRSWSETFGIKSSLSIERSSYCWACVGNNTPPSYKMRGTVCVCSGGFDLLFLIQYAQTV